MELSNSIFLLSIFHEFMWTMATLEQHLFIIYSPRIHVDDSYSQIASFYHLFSTNSCERWLFSNSIFLSSILHEFMWTMAILEQYLFIISVNLWMMATLIASFYHLFSTNSCGRWLLSNNIFFFSFYYLFSMNSCGR